VRRSRTTASSLSLFTLNCFLYVISEGLFRSRSATFFWPLASVRKPSSGGGCEDSFRSFVNEKPLGFQNYNDQPIGDSPNLEVPMFPQPCKGSSDRAPWRFVFRSPGFHPGHSQGRLSRKWFDEDTTGTPKSHSLRAFGAQDLGALTRHKTDKMPVWQVPNSLARRRLGMWGHSCCVFPQLRQMRIIVRRFNRKSRASFDLLEPCLNFSYTASSIAGGTRL
jgi:hypothetical protein